MAAKENHCLNVQQVYDWVTLPLSIQKKICLPDSQRKAMDEICGNFSELTNEFTALWKADVADVSGTVTLSLVSGTLDEIILSINGSIISTGGGKLYTQFFPSLTCIEIKRVSVASRVEGRYCLDLEYPVRSQDSEARGDSDFIVDYCYFSDANGNPVAPTEAVHCSEAAQRRSIPFFLHTQEETVLDQLRLKFEGYVSIRTYERNCLYVVPFCIFSKVLLRAPHGTRLSCSTLVADCLIQSYDMVTNCLYVELELCESIQVLKQAQVEIEAEYCVPRTIHPSRYRENR